MVGAKMLAVMAGLAMSVTALGDPQPVPGAIPGPGLAPQPGAAPVKKQPVKASMVDLEDLAKHQRPTRPVRTKTGLKSPDMPAQLAPGGSARPAQKRVTEPTVNGVEPWYTPPSPVESEPEIPGTLVLPEQPARGEGNVTGPSGIRFKPMSAEEAQVAKALPVNEPPLPEWCLAGTGVTSQRALPVPAPMTAPVAEVAVTPSIPMPPVAPVKVREPVRPEVQLVDTPPRFEAEPVKNGQPKPVAVTPVHVPEPVHVEPIVTVPVKVVEPVAPAPVAEPVIVKAEPKPVMPKAEPVIASKPAPSAPEIVSEPLPVEQPPTIPPPARPSMTALPELPSSYVEPTPPPVAADPLGKVTINSGTMKIPAATPTATAVKSAPVEDAQVAAPKGAPVAAAPTPTPAPVAPVVVSKPVVKAPEPIAAKPAPSIPETPMKVGEPEQVAVRVLALTGTPGMVQWQVNGSQTWLIAEREGSTTGKFVVRTGPDAGCELQVDENVRIRLGRLSRAEIACQPYSDGAGSGKRVFVNLTRGLLYVTPGSGAAAVGVQTPAKTLTIREPTQVTHDNAGTRVVAYSDQNATAPTPP